MQILAEEKLCTILFNWVMFDKPASGSMDGGAKEVCYSDDGPRLRCEGMVKMWPGCFRYAMRNGRIRLCPGRVWSTFKQRLIPVAQKNFTEGGV